MNNDFGLASLIRLLFKPEDCPASLHGVFELDEEQLVRNSFHLSCFFVDVESRDQR